ncbi:DUF2809 domain-containing protein [Dyadobacter sp. CY261]|uniref:ribosomal maturation YjgA family protein n=1 Tax=Dyadobacter sp. CY261 TaxID=2907203 RepID=UPI001F31CAA7|nr:DUF2809 domain-containing protein [Dyadobacter sp. CY261]MCF0071133.1 DUF2809 domain-containing protein [Dyadobacter sp. CY261]
MLLTQKIYLIAASTIFLTEVLIALYVHDDFVRPWGGDVLVVILLYCLLRGVTRLNVLLAAFSVMLFACLVEGLQYLQIVRVLGMGGNAFARTVIGTSFSWMDMAAYAVGMVIVLLLEKMSGKID